MKVFARTDLGKQRETNEDSYYVADEELGIDLFIVADGMGGYRGGNIASSLAVAAAKGYIVNNYELTFDDKEDIKKLVNGSIEYANMIVSEKSSEEKELSEMGSTIIIVLMIKDDIYIGYAGDSRVYRLRGKFLRRLTKDHSYVEQLVEDGKITREESKNHPEKNMITKAIGVRSVVEPTVFNRKFLKGDKLLLCTDGLTNMVSEEKIKEIMQSDYEDPALELVKEANSNGGVDNITVVIVEK